MKETNASSRQHQVGDIVYFGRFTPIYGLEEPLAWTVLEANGDELLLITRDCVLYEPYYYCYGSNVAWKGTSLFKSLRESFFEKAFTTAERMFLQPFRDGECCTILSKEEVEKYMPENDELKYEMRASRATPFADSQFEDYKSWLYGTDIAREAPEEALAKWRSGDSGCSNSWWVRGEEKETDHSALCVSGNGDFCEENHMSYRGVRPCIRLCLHRSWRAAASENGQLVFRQE